MASKYIQPKSLAWWASFIPLVGGVVLALSNAFPENDILTRGAMIVQELAGQGRTAADLIQLGLLGIGLRGAISK